MPTKFMAKEPKPFNVEGITAAIADLKEHGPAIIRGLTEHGTITLTNRLSEAGCPETTQTRVAGYFDAIVYYPGNENARPELKKWAAETVCKMLKFAGEVGKPKSIAYFEVLGGIRTNPASEKKKLSVSGAIQNFFWSERAIERLTSDDFFGRTEDVQKMGLEQATGFFLDAKKGVKPKAGA